MSQAAEFIAEDVSDSVLRSQYNDLVKKRSRASEAEYRLLWAVLEDAIRTYLANRPCSNSIQRKRFAAVRDWFEPLQRNNRAVFSFQNICEFLEIESDRLLKSLKSVSMHDALAIMHHRYARAGRLGKLAA